MFPSGNTLKFKFRFRFRFSLPLLHCWNLVPSCHSMGLIPSNQTHYDLLKQFRDSSVRTTHHCLGALSPTTVGFLFLKPTPRISSSTNKITPEPQLRFGPNLLPSIYISFPVIVTFYFNIFTFFIRKHYTINPLFLFLLTERR